MNTIISVADTTPETSNLSNLSKKELFARCEDMGIAKYKSKNKTELIAMLNTPQIPTDHPTLLLETGDEQIPPSVTDASSKQVHLKPIIKWSGGKSDEIKFIEQYFPAHYDRYLEPFVGGGSVYFYLNPHHAVISDVHTELIDFYKSIALGHSQAIHDFMDQSPNDEITYYNIRDNMKIGDMVDIAKRFYYQRKTCFRGMLRYNKKTGKFNIPFGRYKTIKYNELRDASYERLLARTEILDKGYEYIFENYNDATNFMFLDPPYDSEFTDYGYYQFGKEDHKKLATLFKTTRIKCLMVIGKTDFIQELYEGYIVSEYDKKYKFKIYNNRVGDEINTKHLVIKNY